MRGVQRGQEAGVAKTHPLRLLEVCIKGIRKVSNYVKFAELSDDSGHISSFLQYSLP